MKFSEDQREEIRTWIFELHLLGIRKTKEIRSTLSQQKNTQLSERQIRRYRKEIREECVKSSKFDRDEQVGTAIARLETLYRKCMTGDKPNLSGALAVQKELNELLGIKTVKMELTGKTPFSTWIRDLKPPEFKKETSKPPDIGKQSDPKKPEPAATGAKGGESG